MNRSIFTHWQAVELFSRIVSKIEDTPIETYYDYFKLHELAKKACKNAYRDEITSAINKATKDTLSGKEIGHLAAAICGRIPFITNDSNFDILRRFVGPIDFFRHIKTDQKWEPSEKRMAYEGSVWSLYFYEEIKHNTPDRSINGPAISRATLKFLPFSKVEIRYYAIDAHQVDWYTGTFYNNLDGNYFVLELKTKVGNNKDLKIQLYMGNNNNAPLILGLYSNRSDNMYAGSLILEHETVDEESLPVKLYAYENEDHRKELDKEHLWKFFQQTDSYISVPSGINSVDKLLHWLGNRPK